MSQESAEFTASDVDRIVGERIRRRRILTGLTQDQLGEALGVSYQQIQKYETGANRVSAGRLYLLAERLGVSPGWFFDGLNEVDQDNDGDVDSSSRFTIECVRGLTRIRDERVRSSVLNMIRALADSETASEPAKPAKPAVSNGLRPRAD